MLHLLTRRRRRRRDETIPGSASARRAVSLERVEAGPSLAAADFLLRARCRERDGGVDLSMPPSARLASRIRWTDATGALSPEFRHPHGALLVAWRDGEPAGCAGLRPQAMGSDGGEICRVFAREPFRGQGIGSALLRRLGAEARALGYVRLRIDAGEHLSVGQRLSLAWGLAWAPAHSGLPAAHCTATSPV